MRRFRWILSMITLLAGVLSGCRPAGEHASDNIRELSPVDLGPGEKLRVVATTNIVGDVVKNVGGNLIDLFILMEPGQDPHSYEPAAADIARLENAHVVFVNGLHLEAALEKNLEAVAENVPVVPVSANVEIIEGGHTNDDEHGDADPHTWMDPHNVMIWVEDISAALGALDPANKQAYTDNAAAYIEQLVALDGYIKEQTARIPEQDRKLVTNHEALGYFARRYGFHVIGTVYLGASGLSEPSAGDLAKLIDTIRAEDVRAIFVETTVSDETAQIIAAEAGHEVRVLALYTGSIGAPGSGADSYLGMMRANIDTIVSGLLGE